MNSSSLAKRTAASVAQTLLRAGRRSLAAGMWAALSLAAAFAVAPAQAVIGTADYVPGATLLLPYFEVDLNDPNGAQSSFSVVNTARQPTTLMVTVWTDYAVPSVNFNLYLGGRDTVEVDLGLLFTKGILPQTSPSIGAAGSLSDPHAAIASCTNILPAPSQQPAPIIAHLKAAHTGQPSTMWGGQCGGAALGDAIARGYVTIDVTNGCSLMNPTSAGYFVAGGAGVAANRNVLIGESKQINRNTNLALTEPLVPMEASNTSPVTTQYDLKTPPGPVQGVQTAYTFYGRFAANAADNREPLPSIFAGRVINGGAFPTGTTVTVWRDLDRAPGTAGLPFACNAPPAKMPEREVAVFDEQERIFYPGGQAGVTGSRPLPGFVPNLFPRAAQRVHTSALNAPAFGWAYIDLLNGDTNNSYFHGARQGFVSVQHLANGKFGGSLNAKSLFNISEWALRAGTGANNAPPPPFYAPVFPDLKF